MPVPRGPNGAVDSVGLEAAPPTLDRIRNMWQFASLCQWIYIFGKAAHIDESIDIEDIETECLKPCSTLLSDIGLAILKVISTHRSLTPASFDDYARKQYQSMSCNFNPFGNRDKPSHFINFDALTKIRVLQQLTQWTMIHPERLRDKMEEQKDSEQTSWRIEPYGWDRHDRTYYVLDDNRVYRLSEAFRPHSLSYPTTYQTRRSTRGPGKRPRGAFPQNRTNRHENAGDQINILGADCNDIGLGDMTWECIAITLSEVRNLLKSLTKTGDQNEIVLKEQLEIHLLPILVKQEEARKRRQSQRERELLNMAKMAKAKRSPRIASRMEHFKEEERAKAERKRLAAAVSQQEGTKRHQVVQKQRHEILASRENRLRIREMRRNRHQEQSSQLSASQIDSVAQAVQISDHYLNVRIERSTQGLHDLEGEEQQWVFDCLCGMYGHVDDGAHSVACERCNVWQHSKCLGISEIIADHSDFHFVCRVCRLGSENSGGIPQVADKVDSNVLSG